MITVWITCHLSCSFNHSSVYCAARVSRSGPPRASYSALEHFTLYFFLSRVLASSILRSKHKQTYHISLRVLDWDKASMCWYCGLRVIAKESRTTGECVKVKEANFSGSEFLGNVARPGVFLR